MNPAHHPLSRRGFLGVSAAAAAALAVPASPARATTVAPATGPTPWWYGPITSLTTVTAQRANLPTIHPELVRMTAQGTYGAWWTDYQIALGTYYPQNEAAAAGIGAKVAYSLNTLEVGAFLALTDKATGNIKYNGFNFSGYTGDGTDVTAGWVSVREFMFNATRKVNNTTLPTASTLGVPAFEDPDGNVLTLAQFYPVSCDRDLHGGSPQIRQTKYHFGPGVAANLGLSALYTGMPDTGYDSATDTWTVLVNYRNDKANESYRNYAVAEVTNAIAKNTPDLMHFDDFTGGLFQNANSMGDWTIDHVRSYLAANYTSAELAAMGVSDPATFDVVNYFLTRPWLADYSSPDDIGYRDDERWLSDGVYRAYRFSRLADGNGFYGQIHDTVKTESLSQLGAEIPLSGNVIPFFTAAEATAQYCDYPDFEFRLYETYDFYNTPVGTTNPRIAWATRYASTQSSTGWSIANTYVQTDQQGYEPIHKVIHYDHLASRCVLAYGQDFNGGKFPGTPASGKSVNTFTNFVATTITDRKFQTDIALISSEWSKEAATALAGSQYTVGTAPDRHLAEFVGWGKYLSQSSRQWNIVPLETATATGGLTGVKIAVVPSVVSMTTAQVSALKTFADNGGKVIITGGTGTFDGPANKLKPHTSDILFPLRGNANVRIRTTKPGLDYDKSVSTTTSDVLFNLLNFTDVTPSLSTGAPDTVAVTLNTKDTGGTYPQLTVDAVNYNLSAPDTIVAAPSFTVILKNMDFTGRTVSITYANADDTTPVFHTLSSNKYSVASDGTLHITVPTFSYYVLLVIDLS